MGIRANDFMKDEFTGMKIKSHYGLEEFKKKNPDRFLMDIEMGMENADNQ